MRIGRVFTDSQNIASYSGSTAMSSSFSDLHKAESQNFLLNGNKFVNLKSLIGFTEYRVYCTKPYHGRTNHAKFTNTNPNSLPLFNYATHESSPAPSNLCNALVYMGGDNSKTRSLSCSSLRPSSGSLNTRLYNFIWFVNAQTHLTVWSNSRMDCDDYSSSSPGYNNYGTWLFYVK